MKYLKEYGILTLQFLGFLVLGSILLTIFYYFLFSTKVVMVIGMIYLFLLFFIFGYLNGNRVNEKGFLAGLKTGLYFLLLLFLVNLLFYHSGFSFLRLLSYLLLVSSSVIGAMVGINQKKE